MLLNSATFPSCASSGTVVDTDVFYSFHWFSYHPVQRMSQGHNFLPKFLFVSNLLKAMKIREQVPNDVVKPANNGGVIHHLRTLHRHTVEMLPTGHFPQAFCQLVQGVLLDRAMQTALEQEKKLNWCREVKSLVPLRTNGESQGLGPALLSGELVFLRCAAFTEALFPWFQRSSASHSVSEFAAELILTDSASDTCFPWRREGAEWQCHTIARDGNCLLHAASQYMLGVQDTDLVLRKALYGALKDTDTRNFRMRFQTQLLHSQEFTQTGLRYNTLNWEDEWEKVVKMASPGSSRCGLQHDSLEDIHIFILSNILRRPIIVIADEVLRSMESGSSLSPLNVGGIYLPLHWPPRECYKYPIILGYHSQHFAPLLTVRDSGPEIRAVPLASPGRGGFEELKVHFLLEKEQPQSRRLIGDYLSLTEISVTGLGLNTEIVHAARLDEGNLPEDMDLMEDYLQLVNHEYKRWEEDREPTWEPRPQRPPPFSVSQLSLVEIRCATPRCSYYVSVDTQPHCHECFERRRAGGQGGGYLEAEPGLKPGPALLPSPRSAPPTAPSLSLYSETHAMKCKTAGCLFTLRVEREGLCERCYAARQSGQDWTQRCSLCQQEAPRTFNGLCSSCLQWGSGERPAPASDPGQVRGDSSLSALHRQGCTGQLCKRQGCQYYGTPEKLGYCTICYVDYQTNHRPDPVLSQRLAPSRSEAGFNNAPRCLGAGCNSQGQPMYEGYCSRCFVREQAVRLNRAGPRALRGHQSPPPRAAQPRQTHTQTRLHCSRGSCKNASPGCLELCAECQARGPREGRRTQGPKDGPKQSCRTQGCDHFANQDKHGYCNECDHFKQVYRA
ncbi:hypothetical protein GJAV_G00237060 [Gymnothorax javanicus]|nr:hypothetical protein GJAV_G00237060 [Gymnothorax javanicus]